MNKAAFIEDVEKSRAATAGAAEPTPALVVDQVTHVYHRNVVLDSVSLALGKGEILALVGHSGSGKSTLLRIVAGLEPPLSGRVVINGIEMTGPRHRVPPEKRGVGFMFQDYALFPHMNIARNVMFGLRDMAHDARHEVMRDVLARVGLSPLAEAYPHQLSGGEQQRVAPARALAPHPSVLLMDEPFSNLDRGTRDIVRDETVAALRATGASAILVTHDSEDAMRTADRVVLLRAGKIVQSGSAEDLYARPVSLFVARFFSEFNEVEGVSTGGSVATPVGSVPAAGIKDGARATVCLRPGSIRLTAPGTGRATGRLVSHRFMGESVLSLVEIAGLPRPLQVRGAAALQPGDGSRVGIDFADADILVFPGADEAGAARAASGAR